LTGVITALTQNTGRKKGKEIPTHLKQNGIKGKNQIRRSWRDENSLGGNTLTLQGDISLLWEEGGKRKPYRHNPARPKD